MNVSTVTQQKSRVSFLNANKLSILFCRLLLPQICWSGNGNRFWRFDDAFFSENCNHNHNFCRRTIATTSFRKTTTTSRRKTCTQRLGKRKSSNLTRKDHCCYYALCNPQEPNMPKVISNYKRESVTFMPTHHQNVLVIFLVYRPLLDLDPSQPRNYSRGG